MRFTKVTALVLSALFLLLAFVGCVGTKDDGDGMVYENNLKDRVNIGKAFDLVNAAPEEYYKPTENGGRLVKESYTTEKYYGDGAKVEKSVTVYLPHGYDESGKDLYNIIYLLHGAGGNEETYMGTEEKPTDLKYIIDNAIEKGDIDPVIIAMPTSESNDDEDADLAQTISNDFYKEMLSSVIPCVEGKYRTAAAGDVSEENLKKTRIHRAFGGFSMGSVTTWGVMEHAMDYFAYFLPMCGGSWTVRVSGDSKKPQETAEKLSAAVTEQGYTKDDFSVFVANGSADTFGYMMKRQIDKMTELENSPFVFTEKSFTDGSITYFEVEGNKHEHEATYGYIYNALHYFF